MIFEERKDGDDGRRGNADGELVFPDGELLDVFGQTGHEILAVLVKRHSFPRVFVGVIDDGSGEFARC